MTTEQLPGLQLAVKLLAQIGDNDSDRAIAAVHAVMDQGQPGELPDGLNIAVEMIGEYAESGTCCSRRPAVAIDAIRAEHAQRVTMQHHACDLAQRIAELEAERDEWKQNARNVMDADLVQRAALAQERELRELRVRLAEIEAQEPVAEFDGVEFSRYTVRWTNFPLPDGTKFYARPVPAQAAPDGWRLVLTEARDLFAAYADSHRARGPEHAAKAARNEAMATKISAALAAAPEHKA